MLRLILIFCSTVIFFDQNSPFYVLIKILGTKPDHMGIQGKGKDLVAKIDGDFNNVVGLPVDDLCNELLLLLNNS